MYFLHYPYKKGIVLGFFAKIYIVLAIYIVYFHNSFFEPMMLFNRVFFFLLFTILLLQEKSVSQPFLTSQFDGVVFNDSSVSRVDIIIDQDSLSEILLPANAYSDYEYPATFIFTQNGVSDTVLNVGFCLRGNTSRTSAKKSFKVSFNTFVHGREFHNLEKMNLNGEHNDPSIIRSKLFWKTLEEMRSPGPRANHVEFYINGLYKGLYINVEHEDEKFLQKRYANNNGNFYKCLYPADLNYISNNPNSYKLTSGGRRVYDLKTNTIADDYSDLARFINILHNTSVPQFLDSMEECFNVNAFLRAYAVDVVTGNWDDYAYNQNNFYLYHNPETDKIDYIPYDVDNTYGIDWFGEDWGTRNIYNWNWPGNSRKLVTRLMAQQEYKNRFSFFVQQVLQQFGDTTNLNPYLFSLRNIIAPYVVNDTYHGLDYGYSYNDFLDSYTQSTGGHVPYGITEYVAARKNSIQQQLQLNNVPPLFSETRHLPYHPFAGDSVYIKCWIEDEQPLTDIYLKYKINATGQIDSVLMVDDGLHLDALAADGIYSASIPPSSGGDTIYYFIDHADALGSTGREPRHGFKKIAIENAPQIFINELMAKNVSTVADNYGEFDDWLELYNASTTQSLENFYLSYDISDPAKWKLPDTAIAQNDFMLIWCDEDKYQGSNHANFKLSGSGESVYLFLNNGIRFLPLDSIIFGVQADNVSIGCYPDGVKPIVNQNPATPSASNIINAVIEHDNFVLNIFPNPASDILHLQANEKADVNIYNSVGGLMYSETCNGNSIINLSTWSSGLYMLTVSLKGNVFSTKLMLVH